MEKRFITLLEPYCADVSYLEDLWKKISIAYSSSGRYYHTLQHLSNMTEMIQPFEQKLDNKEAVYLAVWFHDIVYDTKREDNEERSAEALREESIHWNMSSDTIQKATELILCTKKHTSTPENDFDTRLFLDADLAVLGGTNDEYNYYQESIKREYAHYPSLLYIEGRKKVVKYFLDLDPLYKTEEIRSLLEENAKLNLSMELKQLSV